MHEYRNTEQETLKSSTNKKFGIVFCMLFTVIGLLPLLHGRPFRLWALVCAAVFGFLAFVFPNYLNWPNRIWTRFGLLLHTITTPLIMGIMFFGIMTPIGLIMRLCGKNPLALTYSDQPTYWIERKTAPEPDSFKCQF